MTFEPILIATPAPERIYQRDSRRGNLKSPEECALYGFARRSKYLRDRTPQDEGLVGKSRCES